MKYYVLGKSDLYKSDFVNYQMLLQTLYAIMEIPI